MFDLSGWNELAVKYQDGGNGPYTDTRTSGLPRATVTLVARAMHCISKPRQQHAPHTPLEVPVCANVVEHAQEGGSRFGISAPGGRAPGGRARSSECVEGWYEMVAR